ncbi:MAG: sulfolactaldehyde 3-reductase [Alphaproteobacteria bacterium]|nr:sulfolactaldehyde 3-reductase [Alphaproteobacteria bacterium]
MAVVGFVGLGTMGGGMSRNIVKKGHKVIGYDLSQGAVDSFVKAGGTAASSPKAAATGAEFVFTMVPNGPEVEQVVFGTDGIVEGLAKDAIYIDMSTILPSVTDKVAADLKRRGFRMVDAPVGRTSMDAAKGTSLFMVGGEKADVEKVRPILECMGDTIIHCGPVGHGSRMKIVNNYMSNVLNVLTAEALTLAKKSGLAEDLALEVMRQTPAGRGPMNTTYPAKVLKGDVTPAFMIDLSQKDIGLALELGMQLNVPLATGAAARQMLAIARAMGRGRDDWTAIYQVIQQLSATPKA